MVGGWQDRLSLAGQAGIVTGAGSGMGRAIATEIGRRGADVAVWDINASDAQETVEMMIEAGCNAYASQVDVSMADSVQQARDEAIHRFGAVDILVNCAGILRTTSFGEIKLEEWEQILAVNLTGVFLCCQAVFAHMKKRGSGRIVNISSSAGRSTSDLGGAHYTVSKAGVLGLTRHLAKEGGPEIAANAVCPGIIDTPMSRTYGTEERIEEIRQHLPLRRIGTSEDVADLVAFLVSDAASYITGESIEIDGGELMI